MGAPGAAGSVTRAFHDGDDMTKTIRTLLFAAAAALLALPASADAKKPPAPTCPDAVKATVAKAYPDGKMTSCKHEVEDGREQFEAKVTRKDGGRLELDVATDGTILQTEEVIALGAVPAPVLEAFAAKYPKAKATRAEKQTHGDGGIFYELAFQGDKGRKEATFAANGTFTEEE